MLDLLLENLAMIDLRPVGVFLAVVEDRLDLLDPSGHAHIFVHDLEALHQPDLPILEFLEGNRVGDVAQFSSLTADILHFFVPMEDGGIVVGPFDGRDGAILLLGRVVRVLYLHEVEEVLRVGFTLQPQLVFLHCRNRLFYYYTSHGIPKDGRWGNEGGNAGNVRKEKRRKKE